MSASDRRRSRERRQRLPKCHVCAHVTERICRFCGLPSCKYHSKQQRIDGRAVPGSWTCSACEGRTDDPPVVG
jgi:hypothetical protein